ncbi:MAG: DUF3604 domain-containing protein [Proteobacteria bacterium]|nr:DUF3604 domain-containing protein [Pseudomonadota bacterium]
MRCTTTVASTIAYFALTVLCGIASADYLTPEMRTKVDALKLAVAREPTTRATYDARSRVAWDWLNAWAMAGGNLPVNITTTIRPVVADGVNAARAAGLDYYIAELTLYDEQPDALGTLVADLGPFEARSMVTIRQRYVVGSLGIAEGGGLMIARHFMPGYGVFQVSDPGADNFVSIDTDRDDVSFVPDIAPMSGMHGGFRGAQPTLVFRVRGSLSPGDVVTVTYGDQSGGGGGLLLGAASTDFMPVPLYVDLDGSGHFYALPIAPIRVTGTTLAGVHAFAPSVVRPGEQFDISVRAQDRYFNRAQGPIPSFLVYANGQEIGRVAASEEAISVIRGVSLLGPDVYRITVRSQDGGVAGDGNPIQVSADATRIHWGDTHGHSGFAEGIGTPERFMEWAREDARLDFVTHSEHDIWMDDREWQVLNDMVVKYSEPGRFVGYLGYEWTNQNTYGGHHNVLFRDTDDRARKPVQFYPTLSALYTGLRQDYATSDVLVIPHAHQSGDYRQSDPDLAQLVEIMSQHGTFEWFGRMYLSHGHEVGFIAASDNHLSQPGYTNASFGYLSQRGGLAAVLTNEGTRDGIFDAMKQLRTYATTGDRIIMDVSMNGTGMGQRAPFANRREISGRVIGTAPVDTISVIRNGVEIWRQDYLTDVDRRGFDNEETFYVTFESPSVPKHPMDNPRGARGWPGKLTVKDATLVDFHATDFMNPDVTRLTRDGADPNTLHFVTGTRGDTSSIVLRLANIKRRASVTLDIDEAPETGSGPPRFRRHQRTPASSVVMRFRDLVAGQTRATLPFDIYEDTMTLRRVITRGPDDVSFSVVDEHDVQGDYYFVRARLANDAIAWSSPIWVGGMPPR